MKVVGSLIQGVQIQNSKWKFHQSANNDRLFLDTLTLVWLVALTFSWIDKIRLNLFWSDTLYMKLSSSKKEAVVATKPGFCFTDGLICVSDIFTTTTVLQSKGSSYLLYLPMSTANPTSFYDIWEKEGSNSSAFAFVFHTIFHYGGDLQRDFKYGKLCANYLVFWTFLIIVENSWKKVIVTWFHKKPQDCCCLSE